MISEFELVLSEAHRSGTGAEFDPKELEVFVASRLAFLHDSDQTPETPYDPDSYFEVETFPEDDKPSDTDMIEIARVRFLGRALINRAKQNLLAHHEFPIHNNLDATTKTAWRMLRSRKWQAAHPETDLMSQDTSKHPDVASPLRLQSWPDGEYVNCLGISIALAAYCELNGVEYVYANELRLAQRVINHHHAHLQALIERYMPAFHVDPRVRKTFAVLDGIHPHPEKYRDILFDTPPILQDSVVRADDFHHYVVIRALDGGWMQLDPYRLVWGYLSEATPNNADAFMRYIRRPQAQGEVVAYDDHDEIGQGYRLVRAAADTLANYRTKFRNFYGEGSEMHLYKSANFFSQMYIEQIAIADGIVDEFSPDAGQAVNNEEFSERLVQRVWYGAILSIAKEIFPNEADGIQQQFNQLISIWRTKAEGADDTEQTNNAQFLRTLETRIHERMQYDKKTRDVVNGYFQVFPFIVHAIIYRDYLTDTLQVRDRSTANTAAEFAEPEFMIGAMYMNHYATWRKDGRINIARHLARLSRSQLLWQAAHQDGGVEDERIQLRTRELQSKRTQSLHPLVSVVRGAVV